MKTLINRNTKLLLDGRGVVTVRPNDHVATGGEGSVFRVGSSVVKLYTDKDKMKRDGMDEKIRKLSGFKHPSIVAPGGLVKLPNGSQNPIGYYMPYVDADGLSQVFTSTYWQRSGFTKDHAKVLSEKMFDVVNYAHKNGAVMVDANELNWLVSFSKRKGPVPWVIDVDSWAIDRWKSRVIMPSIRDYQSKEFNELTDWFSWGILSFQVFTGIHPYKGVIDGYKRSDLEKRMRDNVSVFEPGIRLNKAVRDFKTHIPGPLFDWYVETFKNGNRSMPPKPSLEGASRLGKNLVFRARQATHDGVLMFTKMFETPSGESIERIYNSGFVLLSNGDLVDLRSGKRLLSNISGGEVVRWNGGVMHASAKDGLVYLVYGDGVNAEPISVSISATKIFRSDDRLFAVSDRGLGEIKISTFGKKHFATVGNTWGVVASSTKWFEGVGIQDYFGSTHLIFPFGESSCAQVRVSELDGYTSIIANGGGRYVSVVGVDKKGGYVRFEFVFNSDHSSYSVRKTDVSNLELNTVSLPKGVVASVHEDGELTLFVPSNGKTNVVNDSSLSFDTEFARVDNTVVMVSSDRTKIESVRLSKK